MKKIREYLFAIVILALTGLGSNAQLALSSLSGTVSDRKGNALSEAEIRVVHRPSGRSFQAVSNEKGVFFLDGLAPGGPYEVEILRLGMTLVSYSDIILPVGRVYSLDVLLDSVMESGKVIQSFSRPFNPVPSVASAVFSSSDMDMLPSVDGNISDIIRFTPQIRLDTGGGVSFMGTDIHYNTMLVDGVSVQDRFGLSPSSILGGQTGSNPLFLEAFEQISVDSAPFDLSSHGFTGGAVNAVTKSGTNKFQGSAWARFLDAQSYGFTAGGAPVRDRMFIFAGGEFRRNLADRGKSLNALAKLDWQLRDSELLTVRYQVNSSSAQLLDPVSDMTNLLSAELSSRLSDRAFNDLRLSATLSSDRGIDICLESNLVRGKSFTLADNFSYQVGRHSISAGVDGEFLAYDNSCYEASARTEDVGLYAQDRWQIGHRLSLSYGIRGELSHVSGGLSPRAYLSPRLGLDYGFDNERRTLLRVGLGAYTGRVPLSWLSSAYGNSFAESFRNPRTARASAGLDREMGEGWKLSVDALYGFGLSADKSYCYSAGVKVSKHFNWGLDLTGAYNLSHGFAEEGTISTSARSGLFPSPLTYCPSEEDCYMDFLTGKVSYTRYDRPSKVFATATYRSPLYGKFGTVVSLTWTGCSGQSANYTVFSVDSGYTALYIPSQLELTHMNWKDPESAVAFENFISNDEYLSSHRYQYSRRHTGSLAFVNRFDLRIAEDFHYDRRNGRKIELLADIINLGNLINSSFGRWYGTSLNRTILINSGTASKPLFSFNYDNEPGFIGYLSAWRCQLGLRLTF